jgi:4-amino-4-deoxy-L-arabinose transferase-like glycosyltransferase
MSRRLSWFVTILVLLCLAGIALELYAMRDGLAVRGDSVRYVMGARNLIAGLGFSRLSGGGEVFPETGFAPLLTFVLAAFGLLGADLYDASRLLNAVLFGGSLFMVGALIAMASRSKGIGLLGCLLVLSAPNVVEWHAYLMSEALFIFLTLLAIYALVVHVQSGRTELLFVAAFAAGAASLARYVGVSLAPAGALAIMLWGRGSLKERAGRAALFGTLAVLPFVLWMARNAMVGGEGVANREFRYHPFRPEMLRTLLFEPTSWLLPESVILPRTLRGGLSLLLLLAGPALFLLEARRWGGRTGIRAERAVLPVLLMILIPLYVAILVVNSLFLDAGTTLGAVLRYLTPLYVLAVLLELTTYPRGLPAGRLRRPLGALLLAALVLVLLVNLQTTRAFAQRASSDLGFPRIEGEWADLAAVLSAQGPDEPILTDNPEWVYYLIDRPAYAMPIKYDPYRQAFREDFPQQIELARQRLAKGAVLVVFGEPSEEEAEVLRLLEVGLLHEYAGAAVFGTGP